ncbi:MAG TPA: serine/threonine-protein kinase, partial [Longimicrobium sp.]|nr:serine/threonine-protein kinase [Longimicrobium sp.]
MRWASRIHGGWTRKCAGGLRTAQRSHRVGGVPRPRPRMAGAPGEIGLHRRRRRVAHGVGRTLLQRTVPPRSARGTSGHPTVPAWRPGRLRSPSPTLVLGPSRRVHAGPPHLSLGSSFDTVLARPTDSGGGPQGWQPPAQFEEYRLIRPLGQGGMGQVFLAHDTVLDRPVAVKFIPVANEAALARVLNEARAAARIHHPNVVSLFRVGRLGPRAYLVSEFTRGTGLNRLQKPVPWREVMKIAQELARGLAAAHRRGVLHLDVKPANAILTESGQVKLLDFGLARLTELRDERRNAGGANGEAPGAGGSTGGAPRGAPLEDDSTLLGTPYYMSPEAWRGEELTQRSDLYSLGAMLYELCSGRVPFRGTALDILPFELLRRDAVPLAQAAPEVDPAFAAIVDRCLAREPLRRFPSAEALLDALQSAEASHAPARVPEGNPYRGLRPFEAEHRAFFFGRQKDLRSVLDRLRAEPFVLLTGDSGVGKSSLCSAGLLPSVQEGALEDGRHWRLLRLVPGARPMATLAALMAPVLGEDEGRLSAELNAEPEALARRLRAKLGGSDGQLLYIDQMEELVTLSHPAEAHRFAEVMAPLALGLPGVRLVGSVRSDFLTRLSGLPLLGETFSRAIHLVRPLGPEEVREAVVGPARVKGVSFESEALVRTLVDSTVAAGGGLPLLQFALAQLWEARDVKRAIVTSEALAALGGVAGALARHADGVIDTLPADQRNAARLVLLRLVTDDGTRARRIEDELTGGDPRCRAALEALVRGRLLVARETDDGNTFEVAHE